jgi:hypothetical protein
LLSGCCCCCCDDDDDLPTPVKLDTRCKRLSRDLAGDVGALVVRLEGLNGNVKSAAWLCDPVTYKWNF